MGWPFLPNLARKNVIPKGKEWVFSDTFGLIISRSSAGNVESHLANQYPNIVRLLSRWLKDSGPEGYEKDFPYTSINVNFDYAARLHRDGRNAGPSLIRALGQFTGGQLEYYQDDDGTLPLVALPPSGERHVDISKKFLLFDGNRAHGVQDFIGERFSIVFYTAGGHDRTEKNVKQALMKSGVRWPTKASLSYFQDMTGRPQGYMPNISNEPTLPDQMCRKRPAAMVEGAAQDTVIPNAKGAQGKRYKVMQHPHLHLNLQLQKVYTSEDLVKRCHGDLSKITALRRKLTDESIFLEVTA